ncbi:MAG: HEAT repeat domain-containing protein [Deltaproteobacteria bacterium]
MPASSSSAADRLARLSAATGPEREALILAALEDEAASVREQAIRLATRYVEPQVLGGLVADGANAARRNGALAALERQGPYAVPYLAELLQSPDAELVMFALQVLARVGDLKATAGILPLLQHADPNVAQAAVEALGRLRSAEAVPALLELLEGNLWLQLAAVTALGEVGDGAAVEPLLRLVPDSFVAEQAVRALQRIAAPEALAPLLDLLIRVHERPLRDAVLEAVGVVLDLHPDPGAAGERFARDAEQDRGPQGIAAFLGELLRTVEAEAECHREMGTVAPGEREALAQAAVAVILTGRLRSLYPLVLRRAGDPDAEWVETQWRRHARLVREETAGLLGHRDPQVRRGILAAGAFDGDDLPGLLARLGDEQAAVRAAACRALGRLGDGRAAPALVARIQEGGPEERAEAAVALGRLPIESLEGLCACLDPRAGEDTVVAALEAVRVAAASAFEADVLALARAPSAGIRLAALRAAAALPGSRTELALFRGLGDRDERVQMEVLELLVERGGDRTGATLIALLSAADSIRFRVIRALGRLRVAEAVPKLESLYPDAPLHERVEILRALAAIAPPGVTDLLRTRLGAPEPDIRHVAAFGLAQVAGPEDIPTLVAMAGDDDWAMRNEAARGLGRLGLPESRSTLLTLVRDVEPLVARTARGALDGLADGPGTAAA